MSTHLIRGANKKIFTNTKEIKKSFLEENKSLHKNTKSFLNIKIMQKHELPLQDPDWDAHGAMCGRRRGNKDAKVSFFSRKGFQGDLFFFILFLNSFRLHFHQVLVCKGKFDGSMMSIML